MRIRSRIESLRRRLDAATAPGPREFQRVLGQVTAAALGRGAPPTAADIDCRIGLGVLQHLRIHAQMRTAGPAFDRVAKKAAVQQLAEEWPTTWSNTAMDDALRIARAIFDNGTGARDVAFEPCSGGSPLIVAERGQKATGRDATLDGDGRTFTAIAAERGLS